MNADLAGDDPAPSFDDWREAARKSLKGGDVAELEKKTDDGIPVRTLYVPGDRAHPALAPANQGFLARPRIDLPDIVEARAQAQDDVENGCGGLIITAQGAHAQAFGIELKNAEDVKRFLDGLPVNKISARLETGNNLELTGAFLQAGFAGIHPGFDFLGAATLRGTFDHLQKRFSEALELLAKYKPKGAGFVIDARLYHNAGASDAQELALALSSAVENLRLMEAHGLQATESLNRFSLLLATDARQFISIAKLRAMRLLWARFCEVVAGKLQDVHLSAETSFRMLTLRDPHTNLMRNTLAAFAAIIGGAEKITVLPFTAALGLPDAFARRMARNTLNLLRDESHAAKARDAANGSAYVEEFTLQFAQSAWAIFQDIEKQGGLLKALRAGEIQRAIAEKREVRSHARRAHEKEIVGITAFADTAPQDVSVLKKMPPQPQPSAAALNLWREAQEFENEKEAAA